MTAIFLDIDGVLNDHRKWPNGYSPIVHENVLHLNTILEAVPEAKIILSSAWRYPFSERRAIEALLCCHGANAYGRVYWPTSTDAWAYGEPLPSLNEKPKEWWEKQGLVWRVMQIKFSIEVSGIKRYVVLDDLLLNVPNLVQTRRDVGLTAADAERAIRVLRGEQ